jgi:DeoR/GlpR family transcriptional regulator of sugar metabolism
MMSINRLEHITNQLTVKKFVSVEELSQELGVSGETIRRDLKALEEKGVLKRTYGGAYLEGSTKSDVNVQVRKEILLPNKEQIAILCCQFIKPDDTIFLDSSTTSLEIAKRITQMPVTVITHSLLIVNFLSDYRNIRIATLGGVLDTVNMCSTGQIALDNMRGLYARKGFISCRTVSSRYGVMDSNEQIGQVRTAAIQNCYKRYLVADHTKFGNTSLYKIADFDSFNAVITDQRLPEKWMTFLEEREIPVHYPTGVEYPKISIEPSHTEDDA